MKDSEIIERIMSELNLGPSELAGTIDQSPGMISSIRTGNRKISKELARKLFHRHNISVAFSLLGEEPIITSRTFLHDLQDDRVKAVVDAFLTDDDFRDLVLKVLKIKNRHWENVKNKLNNKK